MVYYILRVRTMTTLAPSHLLLPRNLHRSRMRVVAVEVCEDTYLAVATRGTARKHLWEGQGRLEHR
jgi:hypothetical protein